MAEETADAAQSRKTGIRAGLAVIAFGLVTAILLYIVESRSTRFMVRRMRPNLRSCTSCFARSSA